MSGFLAQSIDKFYIERESDITCNKWYWTFLPIGTANSKEEMEEKICEYFRNGFNKIAQEGERDEP